MANHLIEASGRLLDSEGHLREAGYQLRPPFYYERKRITANHIRIKEWDYYLINDDRYALCLTFSDLAYLGLISASVIDFATGTYTTTSELVLAPFGRMCLPASSDVGDIAWANERCYVQFLHTDQGRRLSFSMERFSGEATLEAELLLFDQPRDSMVICTPWDEDPQAFYYNRKIVGMSAQGAFRVGAMVHEFSADATSGAGPAFGLLDWGRGVWTYDNTWYWAVAQGLQYDAAGKPRVVGLNLGYGFGNTEAASENMLFVDGIAHKLNRVDFGIPLCDGHYNYLAPWHMSDDEGRLDLCFTPEIDRKDSFNFGILASQQHQVFGTLDGFCITDDGSHFPIAGLRASAEHIHNRY